MTDSMVTAWARRAPVPKRFALSAVLETCAAIVAATHPRLPLDRGVLAEALAVRYGGNPQTLAWLVDDHAADVQRLMLGYGDRDCIRERCMVLLQELEASDSAFRDRLFSFEQNVPRPPPPRVTLPLPAVEPDAGHPLVRAFIARAPLGFVPPPGLSKHLVELVTSARFATPRLPLDEHAFVGMLAEQFAARPDMLRVLMRLKAAELHLVRSCATSEIAREEMRARDATRVRQLCEHYVAPNTPLDDVVALFWNHLFSPGTDPRALTLERFDGTTDLGEFVLLNGHAGLLIHAHLVYTR